MVPDNVAVDCPETEGAHDNPRRRDAINPKSFLERFIWCLLKKSCKVRF